MKIISSNTDQIEKLTPVLTQVEKREMIDYYLVYEKYVDQFSEKAMEDLKKHSVFGQIIKNTPKEITDANNKLSNMLQKDAILNDNWQPYISHQIEQGIIYAKMGLDFKSWYELVVLIKNHITPLLKNDSKNEEEFLSSLNGMNRFLDIAMGIIGEAYLQEKQDLILIEKEKINKLNKDLEQKVIERTSELDKIIKELNEYQYFFNNNNDLCGIANSEGYFEFINLNFQRKLGYTESEMHNTPFIHLIHPDDTDSSNEVYEKLKAGDQVVNFTNRYRKKDGKYMYLEWNSTPNSVTQKLYCVARDITERKKAETELQTVNKELEGFSYSVSHDLRAPLRAVNGFAKILQEDYAHILDSEGNSILDAIMNNSKKMGVLIDDLLSFSRLGRKEITVSDINMTELVESKRDVVLADNHQNVEFVIHNLLPAKGDEALLRRVWFNLISNALKYSKNEPTIKIEIDSYSRNNEIVYSIKDNGVGFEMQYYDKLFGVFQRLHSQEEFEGTGVGLAIVQKIIHKLHGTIWADSKLNEGTIFYFSLPNINT